MHRNRGMGEATVKHYKTIIVGGGIVGAGLFRDLGLHEIDCLIIDKGDFASQTSQSSSKMLHGGIRYLENFDFHLVQEALHEKNLWLRLAPHLCYEQPFHMPIYQESKYPLWMYRIGLNLYDFLSYYQNSPHRVYNAKEVLEVIPDLKEDGLRGAGVYYDAIVDDAKLTLESIYDGLQYPESEALNYTELLNFTESSGIYHCDLQDTLTGKTFSATANDLVFATGPFTDQLLHKFPINWTSHLAPSKGIHLWLKPDAIKISKPAILQTKDGRVIFVIPERNSILVGTTETQTDENFFNIQASQSDVDYLVKNINYFFPGANLKHDSILSTYAGVRPLVKENASQGLSKISREHKVFRPRSNMHIILGGKLTTFRTMVQATAEVIVGKHHRSYNPNKTMEPLRQPSVVPTFTPHKITELDVMTIIKTEKPRTFDDLVKRRLSIPAPTHWNLALQGKSYEDFFRPLIPELKKTLHIKEGAI